MFILGVELNLAKCRLPKGPKFVLRFESSNARKISLEGGESRSWRPRCGKNKGGEGF